MSVSDPLIKDIKGHTLKLFHESVGGKIDDSSENFQNLCQVIEKIFYKGLIQGGFYNYKKIEPYTWMCSKPSGDDLTIFNYKTSLKEVQNCKNVHTLLGKFRLLVRHCLMKKCLQVPLQFLNESNRSKSFYESNSIIGDEILSAILLSVLLQCSKINFNLQLANSAFLDSTWQIPDLVELEVVPCRNLGINVSFSENKAVIVHIRPNSVASESGEICKGDILANLNGVEINSSCKGRLGSILRLSKGRPVTLTLIKALHRKTQDIFHPMKAILRNLQIDLVKIANEQPETDDEVSVLRATKSGFKAVYLGSVDVGSNGSVKQIEEALKRRPNLKADEGRAVIFEIGEMNIRVVDLESSDIIWKHSYMQISSCGSTPNAPNYVAYIAGNENCDTAANFTCYIFYVKNTEDACTILQSIGQGFYRTHFAV